MFAVSVEFEPGHSAVRTLESLEVSNVIDVVVPALFSIIVSLAASGSANYRVASFVAEDELHAADVVFFDAADDSLEVAVPVCVNFGEAVPSVVLADIGAFERSLG